MGCCCWAKAKGAASRRARGSERMRAFGGAE
jgi:hypothetical protein